VRGFPFLAVALLVSGPRTRRRRKPRRKRSFRARFQLALIALLGAAGYVLWTDLEIRREFEGRAWDVPAQVFARPLEIQLRANVAKQRVVRELDALGYRKVTHVRGPGEYRLASNQLQLHTRGHHFPDATEPSRNLSIGFRGESIDWIKEVRGAELVRLRLEPLEVGRIFPNHNEDRAPIRLKAVPEPLLRALLAVEDRDFFSHNGIDPKGVLRAAWTNLRSGRVEQGGSTLTQQLVKNFYLQRERSIVRKLREVLMAGLLERRYSKAVILQTYLNEVFLGQQGRRAIHGFGLAAEFYFGRPLSELTVDEQALLVGLVKGPSYYDPRRHPQRARARRNLVLQTMVEQGVLARADFDSLVKRPIRVISVQRGAPGYASEFLQLVKRQLAQQYRSAELRTRGLRIYTSYDNELQNKLDQAIDNGLRSIGAGSELEAAAVVADYETGEVLALRGGRKHAPGQFNRALDAARPIGSLIKPAVYLTALGQPQRYHLLSGINDSAITIKTASGVWTPTNFDGEIHGRIRLVDGLSRSYNLATVRLGMDIGLDEVVDTLHALGVDTAPQVYPSLLLGALELSPMSVTQMYQVLANGGYRLPLHSVRGVLGPDGRLLSRAKLQPRQVVDPRAGYLIGYALEQVVLAGTARGAQLDDLGITPVAGKTGTSNDGRDSWFAGYAGGLLAVMWLGHDNNRATGFTGASGALRVWRQFMVGARPLSISKAVPKGIAWFGVNGAGKMVGANCPGARNWPFIEGSLIAVPDGCDEVGVRRSFLSELLP
jgi:penicillin-binding protein 1B